MDGRASRGPGRAVGGTRQSTTADLGVGAGARTGFGVLGARQFAGRALVVPGGRFRHTPSWPVDAGPWPQTGGGGAGPGGAGRRFRDSRTCFSSVTWEVVVNFRHSNFASWWWAI